MLKLSDFFQPINLFTITYFIGSLLFFDIIGTFIKDKYLKISSNYSRVINWLLGLGFFIFVWFLLYFFITPARTQIAVSAIILSLITLPYYIKNRQFTVLFRELWKLKIPFLIVAIFFPAVFIKVSLPPYYGDEMSYHYISPAVLQILAPGKNTAPGIFAYVPRTLDLFWQLIFTAFHTYSVARLFSFSLLVTSMLYAYSILKKNFGLLPAFLFVFVFFSFPQDIFFTSTLGYVDVGGYSFLLIGLIAAIDFLVNQNRKSIILSIIFWAMSLGAKYTSLTSFAAFVSIAFFWIILKRKKIVSMFSRKFILTLFAVFLVFGGFWYLRNLMLFGNPIFPFFLPCSGPLASECQAAGGFFGDWTTKINLGNLYEILSLLFYKHIFAQALVPLVPILLIFGKNKKVNLIIIFAFLSVVIELLILKYFSGFLIRYQQHLQLFLLLVVVLSLANTYSNKVVKNFVKFLIVILLATTVYMYLYTFKYTYTVKMNTNEFDYAIGKMTIYKWLDEYYPRMKYITNWCENPPNGEFSPIAVFEPDQVWDTRTYNDGKYLRIFLTNCYVSNPILPLVPIGDLISEMKKEKMQFWIASVNSCVLERNIFTFPGEKEEDIYKSKINNEIICHSTEIAPNLYYFDYQNLK